MDSCLENVKETSVGDRPQSTSRTMRYPSTFLYPQGQALQYISPNLQLLDRTSNTGLGTASLANCAIHRSVTPTSPCLEQHYDHLASGSVQMIDFPLAWAFTLSTFQAWGALPHTAVATNSSTIGKPYVTAYRDNTFITANLPNSIASCLRSSASRYSRQRRCRHDQAITSGKVECAPAPGVAPNAKEIIKLRKFSAGLRGGSMPTYGVKRRSEDFYEPESEPEALQELSPRSACEENHLVVSNYDGHSARKLFENKRSLGRDFISRKEELFCDMCTRKCGHFAQRIWQSTVLI